MLKACWDCIAGSGVYREREENDASLGTLLNGNTQRAPPWPQPQSVDDIMFLLPRQLNFGDRIEISGVMRNNPNVLSVSLLAEPTYNVACEIEANFQTNNMAIRIVHDGNQEIINGNYQQDQATNYFTDSDFKFTFVLTLHENVQGHLLTIYIRDSFLEQIPLKHSIQDIRYIMLHGDIEKVENLDFKFG